MPPPTDAYFPFSVHRSYDVTAGDRRFVMIRRRETGEVQLIVVENFFEELRRRMGN